AQRRRSGVEPLGQARLRLGPELDAEAQALDVGSQIVDVQGAVTLEQEPWTTAWSWGRELVEGQNRRRHWGKQRVALLSRHFIGVTQDHEPFLARELALDL